MEQTQSQKKQKNEAKQAPLPNRLVDYIAIVQVDKTIFKGSKQKTNIMEVALDGAVAHLYPKEYYPNLSLKDVDFKHFAFPNGVRMSSEKPHPPFYHSFVLTMIDGTHLYG